MNKSFLLLVALTSGFLNAARPGEGEEGGSIAQAGPDAATLAREAQEQAAQEQAARDAAARKPPRGGWSRKRPAGGIRDSQGALRGDGQQEERPSSAVIKGRDRDDGDTQATKLARDARRVNKNPFGNEGEESGPASSSSQRVTTEDVTQQISQKFEDLREGVQELIDIGLPTHESMEDQLAELAKGTDRFREGGKPSSKLAKIVKDVNAATDLLEDKPTSEIRVVPIRDGLKISVDQQAIRIKPIAISFMPKGIIGKIKFCWDRYKLKSALKKYREDGKIIKLAEAIFTRLNSEGELFPAEETTVEVNRNRTFESVQKKREKADKYISENIDAAVGLDWRKILFEK